jgi:uncharacterized membrane protein YfcA
MPDLALAGLAAVAAGAVNALAGGGTLITFPTLTALGLPAVAANVTNTIALAPGHLGATLAQKRDLAGQRARVRRLVPAALLGGLVGGLLLLFTTEKVFRQLVPFLILLASALLAVQERVRASLVRRLGTHHASHEALAVLPVFAASIYGGYFGAGLSVIVLAALGLLIDDSLTRLNATKQAIGFAANGAAAVLFLFSGQVHWVAALVMAVAAVAGGAAGGRLAGRVRPATLRLVVVTVGVVVGVVYLVRG